MSQKKGKILNGSAAKSCVTITASCLTKYLSISAYTSFLLTVISSEFLDTEGKFSLLFSGYAEEFLAKKVNYGSFLFGN